MRFINFIKDTWYRIFPRRIEYPETPVENPQFPVTPEQPSNEKGLLWYPKAKVIKGMKAQGTYPMGYPQGAILHYTGGRDESDEAAMSTFHWGAESGLAFFLILPSGQVIQSLPLNLWGSHAGTSYWQGLGNRVSNRAVGIEIACCGELTISNKASFGYQYPQGVERVVTAAHECSPGRYKKFTQAQEDSLVELLVWLKLNKPDVFNTDYILGHDQVSGPEGIGYYRKIDPGGSLSMTKSNLRLKIKQLTNREA